MPRNKLTKTASNRQDMSRLMYVTGIILIILAVCLWWHNVYTNPNKVFWKMMNNNLATQSVTKHVIQEDQGQNVDQYTELRFGSQNAARNYVKISQDGTNGTSQVKSESIGTLTNDYSRYIEINSAEKGANGQSFDFSKITGVWGKTPDADKNQTSQVVYFRQAALNSVVSFGWLDAGVRHDLINFMQNKQVYNVDFAKVQKKKENGKNIYVYPVEINAQAYITMLQHYVQKAGIDAGSALDASQYADVPPIQTEFSVDAVSRKLVQIHYTASNRNEDFMSYGLSLPIEVPGKTIPIDELQQRLQTIQ
jgi:hypothetical protein